MEQRQRTAPKPKLAARKRSFEHSKRASATKRGPGRRHSDGATKASPIKDKGAPRGFVLHTNPGRRERRDTIKEVGGIRHFKRIGYIEREFASK